MLHQIVLYICPARKRRTLCKKHQISICKIQIISNNQFVKYQTMGALLYYTANFTLLFWNLIFCNCNLFEVCLLKIGIYLKFVFCLLEFNTLDYNNVSVGNKIIRQIKTVSYICGINSDNNKDEKEYQRPDTCRKSSIHT